MQNIGMNRNNAGGVDAAYAAAFSVARKNERQRLAGILTHAEAKHRQSLARSVAFDTDLTVEQAIKLLAAAPKHANASALATLMAGIGNPDVGCDPDDSDGGKQPLDAEAIYAARRRPIDRVS